MFSGVSHSFDIYAMCSLKLSVGLGEKLCPLLFQNRIVPSNHRVVLAD